MSFTVKNTLRLTLDQAVKQGTYTRRLQPGDFTSLKNVRRYENGPPEKRKGYDRTTTSSFTAVGTTYAGPATEIIPAEDVLMWRDTNDQIWNRSGSTGYYRGTDRSQVFPRYQQLENQAGEGRAHKPLQVLRNGNELWEFSLGVAQGLVSGYQVTVLDATTRQPLKETTRIGADGIVSWAAAVDGSNNVWLFYIRSAVGARHVIMAHKWTSYLSSGTETTYATLTGYLLESIDAWRLSSTGEIVVAATSFDSSTSPDTSIAWWSYLDTATGAAKVSPAPVSQTNIEGAVEDARGCNGMAILKSDGSNGFFYLAYVRPADGPDGVDWIRIRVNATTLAVDDTSVLQYVAGTSNATPIGVAGGYLSGTSEVWGTTVVRRWNANDLNSDGVGLTNISSAVTYKHVHASGVTTTTVLGRSAYLAAKPLQVGSGWYWLTGFQDGAGAQHGYWWRDSDGNLLTPVLDGEAAQVFHAGGLAGGFGAQDYTYAGYSGHVVDGCVLPDGNVAYPLLRQGLTTLSPNPVIATIDLAPQVRSLVPGIIAGAVPKRVSVNDALVELSPVNAPYEPITIVANGPGPTDHSVNVVSYRYLTQGSDGLLYVSDSYPLQTLTFEEYASPDTAYTIRIPTNRHTFGRTYIALYGSANGETVPYLQRVLLNDSTVDYIDLDVAPSLWADTGETLDTLGGALTQSPLPPARLAFVHKDRVILAGTPDDTVWPSQELEAGRGPEFNEALAFSWADGTGEIQAGISLNNDAFILFRKDAIGVVAGAGPDGNALNGAYQVATVQGKLGCSNPRSVVAGDQGVYFKGHQDGRFYLTSGGVPADITEGIEDYIGETITAAVYHTSGAGDKVVLWYCASGKKLILDVGRATADQPYGQWYVDDGAGLLAAVDAAVIGGAPVALAAGSSSEAVTFQPGSGYTDNGSAILTDYVIGPVAPGGLLTEFDTLLCQLSSTQLGSGSTYEYTLTDDQGTNEVHTDVTDATADVAFMTGLNRTREFSFRIRETASGGRGRIFDGLAIQVGVYPNRTQNPRRRIQ